MSGSFTFSQKLGDSGFFSFAITQTTAMLWIDVNFCITSAGKSGITRGT